LQPLEQPVGLLLASNHPLLVRKKSLIGFFNPFRKWSEMAIDIPYVLPLIFGVSLVAALIIYRIGGRISPKSDQNKEKNASYSCGEQAPLKEAKLDVERFLTFAVYFLIFDVLAFVTMTSFYAADFMPVVYSLIVLIAVGMLVFARKRL
jgi:NADH:ubiquinone oxidoreductase subunit 3 (subunit A)